PPLPLSPPDALPISAISSKPWFWIPLAKLQHQFGTGRPPTTLVVIRPTQDSPVGLGLLKNPVRRRPHRLLPIARPKLRPWRHYQDRKSTRLNSSHVS